MARPITITLAELEARHASEADKCKAAATRGQARALARSLALPIPTWAQRLPAPRPFGGHTRREPTADTKAVSTFIPSELRAFRARNRGSVVHIGQSGVSLITTAERLTFSTMSEAVAYAVDH